MVGSPIVPIQSLSISLPPKSMISPEDRSRMKYYLAEMREKFAKHPESLCLRNGIAAIEEKLGLPKTIAPCDPIEFLDNLEKESECN